MRVGWRGVGVLTAMLLAGASAHAQEMEVLPELPGDLGSVGPGANARAQAIEVLPPAHTPSLSAGNLLFYGGLDAWRHGGSAYIGSDWSLPASGSVGPVLRLFAANGIDEFKTGSLSYRTDTARVSILPGVRLQSGPFEVKLFGGADYAMRAPLQSGLGSSKHFVGARVAADLWWEPTAQWMVSASASATSIEDGRSARLAAGWRLPFAWVGPEFLMMHDIYNTQYRFGAHLTGLKVGATEWSLAGGYARDSFHRSGPYARIGVAFRL